MAYKSWAKKGANARPKGFVTPKVAAGHPKIMAHNYDSIHDALPTISQAETSNNGIAKMGGKMTANYPVIHGFNGGPGGSLEQPLVTQTGFKGYL